MRLKDITILSPQYIERGVEDNVSFVPMESLRNGNIEYKTIPINQAKGKYTYFGNGDLLVAKVTPCFENGNIAIANNLLNGIGFGSSEIFVLRPSKRMISQYLFYLSQSGDFQGKVCATMCGVGGLKRISPLFMRTYELDVPSLKTQQRIITYLDTKLSDISHQVSLLTSKRDAYLRLKKSIINHAVTHGLNPNVKMKDSGIDWIGEVPEHWEVKRMKDIAKLMKGRTPEELTFEEISYPYLTMDYLRNRPGKEIMYPQKTVGLLKVDASEILVLWDGANAGEFILSKEGYLGSTMAVFSCDCKMINKNYLYYLLKSIEEHSKYFANGTTIPHFDCLTIMNHQYAIPPLPEQHAIATYLDAKCAKIDTIVSNLDKQISRYTDLKRALIDEVITGKRAV